MESLLHLQGVKYLYRNRLVLDIPELRIGRGVITGLAGPNGSGKSTLLRVLSLTDKPAAGTVRVAGSRPGVNGGKNGSTFTLLPQETYLLRRTVFDNIAYGLRIRGLTRDLQQAVREGLDLVGLDPAFAMRRWHELSGGEAQRVALAARLVLRPACLLLDEPIASVDLESGRGISRAVLLARREWNTTLVIASHDRSWLSGICDRIVHLYNGRVLEGSFDNVLLGPWENLGNDEYGARLADGQLVVVAGPPPRPLSSVVIAPTALLVAEREPAAGERVLRGVVTGLTMDRSQAGLRVQVTCGDHPFIAALPDRPGIDPVLPGRQVTLRYRPTELIWLE